MPVRRVTGSPAAGQRDAARVFYLEWMEAHLRHRRVTDPELWSALHAALDRIDIRRFLRSSDARAGRLRTSSAR